MFVNADAWRRRERTDDIFRIARDRYRDNVVELYPCALYGRDHDGYPLFWQRPDPGLAKRIVVAYPPQEVTRYSFYVMERCREICRLLDPPVDRFSVVLDVRAAGPGDLMGVTGDLLTWG
eukprot:gene23663-64533_t